MYIVMFVCLYVYVDACMYVCMYKGQKIYINEGMRACVYVCMYISLGIYSLYSTRMQSTWHRGLALGNAPNARILRYPTQNIPTCWYILRWITHIFRVLPDAFYPTRFTRRQSVEYRWR